MEKENRLRQQVSENNKLIIEMHQVKSDLDALSADYQGTLTQMDLIKKKGDEEAESGKKKLVHFEQIILRVNSCQRTFCQFSKDAVDIQDLFSKSFKDLLQKYRNAIEIKDMYSIEDSCKKLDEIMNAITKELKV